jgi:hypothetical protein
MSIKLLADVFLLLLEVEDNTQSDPDEESNVSFLVQSGCGTGDSHEEEEDEESKNTKTLVSDKDESSSSSSSSESSSSKSKDKSSSKDKPSSNVSVHEEEEEEESNISKPSITSSYITDKKNNEQQPSVKSITSNGSSVYRPSFSNQPESITVSITNTPKKSKKDSHPQSNLNISVSATPMNKTPQSPGKQTLQEQEHQSESKLQKPIQNKENHIYNGRDEQSGNYYSIYVDKFVSENDVIYITSLFIKIYKSDSDETVVETKSIKELLGIDSIKKEDAVGYVGDIIKKLNTKVDDADDDDEYANEFMDDQFEVAVLEEEL